MPRSSTSAPASMPTALRLCTGPSLAPAARARVSASRRASSTALVSASRSSSLRLDESRRAPPDLVRTGRDRSSSSVPEALEVAEFDLDLAADEVTQQHLLRVLLVPAVLGLDLQLRRVDVLRVDLQVTGQGEQPVDRRVDLRPGLGERRLASLDPQGDVGHVGLGLDLARAGDADQSQRAPRRPSRAGARQQRGRHAERQSTGSGRLSHRCESLRQVRGAVYASGAPGHVAGRACNSTRQIIFINMPDPSADPAAGRRSKTMIPQEFQ